MGLEPVEMKDIEGLRCMKMDGWSQRVRCPVADMRHMKTFVIIIQMSSCKR